MAVSLLRDVPVSARKALKAFLLAASVSAIPSNTTFAQVPVADVARQSQETSIAKCMTAANGFNKATVPADTGTHGSVAAPAATNAASTATVGASNVTGWAGTGASGAGVGGTSMASVGTGDLTGGVNVSSGSIGSMNFSSLLNGAAGAAQGAAFNIATGVQVLSALSNVSGALATNSGALTAAAAMVGTLNPSQGAWDQNTAARLAAIATWNQAIQAATTTAQLRNQLLLSRLSAAAAAAAMMKAQ
jgi:hypothetical protein